MRKNYDVYKNISEKIKEYRKEQGLTQLELAEKVNISISYLSKIEATNCNKSFSLDILIEIANVLEKDLKDFFN